MPSAAAWPAASCTEPPTMPSGVKDSVTMTLPDGLGAGEALGLRARGRRSLRVARAPPAA